MCGGLPDLIRAALPRLVGQCARGFVLASNGLPYCLRSL